MKLNKNRTEEKVELQIAPLIDVVFLLLIYFMVTASLIKKEADISFVLPASVPAKEMVELPVEILIEISPTGIIQAEGLVFGPEDILLDDLASHLRGLQAVAQSQRSPFSVNLLPSGDTLHDRVINVMDACAAAGVKNLSFSKSM